MLMNFWFSFVYRDQVGNRGDPKKAMKGFQGIPFQKYKACPKISGLGCPEERCSVHGLVSKMWLVKDELTGSQEKALVAVQVKYFREDVFCSLLLPGNCKHTAESSFSLLIVISNTWVCSPVWYIQVGDVSCIN